MNGVIEDIAAEIGFTAALALIEYHGGRVVMIPVRPSPDHPIARTVGMPALTRLCAAWAGEVLYIEGDTRRARIERRALIARLAAEGLSTRAIARAIGIGERRVQQILAELRGAGIVELAAAGELGPPIETDQTEEVTT